VGANVKTGDNDDVLGLHGATPGEADDYQHERVVRVWR